MDITTWTTSWLAASRPPSHEETYQESAQRLRQLIRRTDLLRFQDARDAPERFFLAHRLLVSLSSPGFPIRFTVNYNLFAGTILGLGDEEQVNLLNKIQQEGSLGCFCLTEKLAGVHSGLVVLTRATWDEEKKEFDLHCETEDANKIWISQGLTAEWSVVVADLWIQGKSKGPHAFLVRLREEGSGKVCQGVTLVDMGLKTTANDLDNAMIRFEHVKIPKSSLLRRFGLINEEGKYVQTTGEKMRIEVIGQRLLTGRVAIAQAAVSFARQLTNRTKAYSDAKKCWAPGGSIPLSSVPQLSELYRDAYAALDVLDHFCALVEARLNERLKKSEIPEPELVEAIAVAKVACADTAIALAFRLRNAVGSYSLAKDSGFVHTDFLTCTAFAEGETRTLLTKIARDRLKLFQSKSSSSSSASSSSPGKTMMSVENELCARIFGAGKRGFETEWRTVNELAWRVVERTISEWTTPDAGSKIRTARL